MTASIFMTVSIALERYIALQNPIAHRQAMNDTGAAKRRLLKYIVPVIFLSVVVNIPKFLEWREGDGI
jgi:hypothetical protein